MQLSFGLSLPADGRCVSVVRHLCVAMLTTLGVRTAVIDDVALAVTEACANVVRHAAGSGDFAVRVCVDDLQCRIEVVDRGGGLLDPASSDPADPAHPADRAAAQDADLLTHGRGIGLMRLLVDELDFVPDEAGTTVVLVKQLQLEPGSVLAGASAPAS